MRRVTQHRYYARNGLATNLLGAVQQLQEAARQAGKLPGTKRKAGTILRLARELTPLVQWARELPVLPAEKVLAAIKKRAKRRCSNERRVV